MGVGAADEAEAERVCAQPSFQGQAILQRVAHHVAQRVALDRRRPLVGTLVRPGKLLEGAQLVGGAGADPGQPIEAAFRGALLLVDLDQRLERLAPLRLGGVGRILELPPAAQVRVVGDDQRVAARAGVEALGLDGRPDALRQAAGEGFQMARRECRHVVVAEDDVAVHVAADRAGGVLVADEGGEGARRGAIVGLLGRGLDLVPDRNGRGVAVDAWKRAEAERRRRIRDAGGEQPGDRGLEPVAQVRLGAAEDGAQRIVEHQRARGRAQIDLAVELRVVGDGREVEGTIDGMRHARLGFGVVGQPELAPTPREIVRVARSDAGSRDVGVGRVAGVDVQVAEERLTKRIGAIARLAGFGPLPGRRGCVSAGGRADHQQKKGDQPAHGRTLRRPPRHCRAISGLGRRPTRGREGFSIAPRRGTARLCEGGGCATEG